MSEELKLISQIENMVFIIREQRVMMDSDLAKLYGIETKKFNQAVKRSIERFPGDFMFQCSVGDLDNLRSQIVTAKHISTWNHMRRSPPMLFTELGVAMLSSVLNSRQAVAINIEIMRIFVRLRSFHAIDPNQRIDDLDEKTTPLISKNRKKIGLK
tara:strand:+ start:31665 stop:32132 length:468 start_codon:yes stop_codon:yes gene_type:complete